MKLSKIRLVNSHWIFVWKMPFLLMWFCRVWFSEDRVSVHNSIQGKHIGGAVWKMLTFFDMKTDWSDLARTVFALARKWVKLADYFLTSFARAIQKRFHFSFFSSSSFVGFFDINIECQTDDFKTQIVCQFSFARFVMWMTLGWWFEWYALAVIKLFCALYPMPQ